MAFTTGMAAEGNTRRPDAKRIIAADERTLRQRCSRYIRDSIVSGDLSPGMHLVEVRLAQELGVSRGTLREALRPLEIEGLVVADGRGHMYVRAVNLEEIRDVFEVRAALEVLAVRKLTLAPRRAAICRELLKRLAPLKDESAGFAAHMAADMQFHSALCELTGNRMLISSWSQLLGQIEMMIISAGSGIASGRMRHDEHALIVDAIRSGDVDQAETVIRSHMNDFASRWGSEASQRDG
ncbi:GntR family transcriptional regulator [Microbacterium sp. GXF0217]